MKVVLTQPRMYTTNIILHWIAHFPDQVNKTEARPRPNLEAEANLSNFGLGLSITGWH